MMENDIIIKHNDRILITGASGFIGPKLIEKLLEYGFNKLICFVRPSSDVTKLDIIVHKYRDLDLQIIRGNLLVPDDCKRATDGVAIVYHLAVGTGDKSYPNAFLNSVVTTRNLIESLKDNRGLKRFVNVSSFSVYSPINMRRGALLDESCPLEQEPQLRCEAYCYGKLKQDELVLKYGNNCGLPYVIMRPGVVYGPGKSGLSGRVGTGIFGVYLNLGGSNIIPLTYVDNCADAIALSGFTPRVEGEIFNIVDDDLPTARKLLLLYKKNVRSFTSFYVPHAISYFFCILWEKYSNWSDGQLPPVFNRRLWAAYWKGNQYSNKKLKNLLGWKQKVPTAVGLKRYFEFCRELEDVK
jgi:nucleoside-diphosphate-sugar epimerase